MKNGKLQRIDGLISCLSPQEIAPDRKSCEDDEEEENEGTRRLFSFALQNPMEIVAQEKDAQKRA